MLTHPTIREVSRAFRICETLLTETHTVDDRKFAINTIIDSVIFMHDSLQEAAAEAEEMAQEASNRERELAESLARRKQHIARLRRNVEAKRATRSAPKQGMINKPGLPPSSLTIHLPEFIPRTGKLIGRVEKKKSSKMTVRKKFTMFWHG